MSSNNDVELRDMSHPTRGRRSDDNNDNNEEPVVVGRNNSHASPSTPPPFHTRNNSDNDAVVLLPDAKLSMPKKKSGILGASSNLVNSIVGAGIIGIPYALKESGLVVGVLLLALVALLTDKSLRTIVDLASFHPKLRNRNVWTFEGLASYPFGQIGSSFILLNMFILAYGAMVAYLLIVKDTIPTILGVDDGGIERELILILTSFCIMVPLSMQRDMASLSFTSLISVTADIFLVGFIAYYSPIKETVSNAGGIAQVFKDDSINPTLFIGLGILSTALACQHSAFIVSGSLENKTRTRWATVTGCSIALSMLLCCILGICGYLGYLADTQGDILNNFESRNLGANGARALLAITMFFTYPMESFVARHVLVMLMHGGDMDGTDDPNHSGGEREEAGGYFCFNRRQSWTFFIYFITLIPALIVDDLGPVLSVTGAVGGSCIAYVAPGLVYLGVNGDAFLAMTNKMLSKWTFKNFTKSQHQRSAVTASDLPVAGNAEQQIIVADNHGNSSGGEEGLELPTMGVRINAIAMNDPNNTQQQGCKPIWWYIGCFPIWCAIASTGSLTMRNKMLAVDETSSSNDDHHGDGENSSAFQVYLSPGRRNNHLDDISNDNNNATTNGINDEEEMIATCGEFCIAIFFIVFGVVAVVAGVTSNLWVQLKFVN